MIVSCHLHLKTLSPSHSISHYILSILSSKYLSDSFHSLYTSFSPSSIHPSFTLKQNHLSNLITSLPFTSPYFSARRRKRKSSDLPLQPYLFHLWSSPVSPADVFPSPQITTWLLSHLCICAGSSSDWYPLHPFPIYSSWAAISPSLYFKKVFPCPIESFSHYTVITYLYVSPLIVCELLQNRDPLLALLCILVFASCGASTPGD